MEKNKRQLYIIAGASGEIGQEYVKNIVDHHEVIGISRKTTIDFKHKNLSWLHIDLTKPQDVQEAFQDLLFNEYARVVLIHTIGIDKFENTNYPEIEVLETIDPEVYDSNVNTYKYIAFDLMKKIKNERENGSFTQLTLSMIGSVADKHGVIFLTSFTESKHIVRSYIQSSVRKYSWISGLVINITSTVTKSALDIRPNADTTYWLLPVEVVEQSIHKLEKALRGYEEIDIIKHDPGFDDDYYENSHKIFKRWSHFVWGEEDPS